MQGTGVLAPRKRPPSRSTPPQPHPPLGPYSTGASDVNPPGHGPEARKRCYLMCIPEIARAITSCWISAVPSKMS
jgi:hypothetical protein